MIALCLSYDYTEQTKDARVSLKFKLKIFGDISQNVHDNKVELIILIILCLFNVVERVNDGLTKFFKNCSNISSYFMHLERYFDFSKIVGTSFTVT